MMYKTLHRKQKIEQHELKTRGELLEGKAVPAPLLEPVMLLLLQTRYNSCQNEIFHNS
jgi:hypothetical protein